MKILERLVDSISLEFDQIELRSLIHAVRFVIQELDWEFPIRVGWEVDDAQSVLNKLNLTAHNYKTIILFNVYEVEFLRAILNEILNGIKIVDFEEVIGCRPIVAKLMFDVMDKIE